VENVIDDSTGSGFTNDAIVDGKDNDDGDDVITTSLLSELKETLTESPSSTFVKGEDDMVKDDKKKKNEDKKKKKKKKEQSVDTNSDENCHEKDGAENIVGDNRIHIKPTNIANIDYPKQVNIEAVSPPLTFQKYLKMQVWRGICVV